MTRPTTNPKILLTTAYRNSANDFYDAAGANFGRRPHLTITRTTSAGVRFLKQNVPEIEIMEFPRWHEFVNKLEEGWDVVGFSFFHHDLAEIFRMAAEARRRGVREIWAGGYGGLSQEAEQFADRIFHGYCEEQLAQECFGRKLDRVRHPAIGMSVKLNLPPMIPYKKVGQLFTQRGCPYRCTFCQTPVHSPRPHRIPLESIEEVLSYYRSVGINEVFIFDETFYTFPSHSEAVIDLLEKYRMHWWTSTRVEKGMNVLEDWSRRGLANLGIGVESVRDDTLKKIGKKQNLKMLEDFCRLAAQNKVFIMAYYMIGYQEDTAESILEDYHTLTKIGFDSYQLTVLTPYPKTPLAEHIESRHGVFERDYHKFDARNLVWNHPRISPSVMKYLHRVGMAALNVPFKNYARGVIRMAQKRIANRGFGFIWEDVIRPFAHSLSYNERKHVRLAGNGKETPQAKEPPKAGAPPKERHLTEPD